MPNPVMHWEINARDAKRAQDFYGQLFGWKVDSNNDINYGMVDTGGQGINGGISQTDGPNWVTFYIQVEDIQAYLDKAEKLGGKTVVPVTEIPNIVTFAVFADPEGNRIGLVKE